MVARAETAVRVETIAVHRRAAGTIAVVGNPNGQSSVFNRLTGLPSARRTAGVTVERHVGRTVVNGATLDRSFARHVFAKSELDRRANRGRRSVRPCRGHAARTRFSR
jgi:hypothetical protein